MIDRFLGDAFGVLSCQFWQDKTPDRLFCRTDCSAVWCSAADTHLKLVARVVSGARLAVSNMGVCDIAHRRSVAVLCMLYKIRCNPVHPLNGALPLPYVPVRVTRGALVAHRYT